MNTNAEIKTVIDRIKTKKAVIRKHYEEIEQLEKRLHELQEQIEKKYGVEIEHYESDVDVV